MECYPLVQSWTRHSRNSTDFLCTFPCPLYCVDPELTPQSVSTKTDAWGMGGTCGVGTDEGQTDGDWSRAALSQVSY